MEFTPTESSAGSNLLYIANHLSYKSHNDLNIYKKFELESTFMEVINPQKSNIITGSIYRHPSMDLDHSGHPPPPFLQGGIEPPPTFIGRNWEEL